MFTVGLVTVPEQVTALVLLQSIAWVVGLTLLVGTRVLKAIATVCWVTHPPAGFVAVIV